MLCNTLYGEQNSQAEKIGRFPFGNGKRKTLFKGSKVMTHLQNDFPVYNALDMPPPAPPRVFPMPIKYYKMRQNTRTKKKQKEQKKAQEKLFWGLTFGPWPFMWPINGPTVARPASLTFFHVLITTQRGATEGSRVHDVYAMRSNRD